LKRAEVIRLLKEEHSAYSAFKFADPTIVDLYSSAISLLEGKEPADEEKEETEIQCGYLLVRYGIKGFVVAVPGHPVFSFRDKIILYLTNEVEGREPKTLRVPFNKSSVKEGEFYSKEKSNTDGR
jgi:hypothetical protein